MNMVLVSPGQFVMGSPADEAGRWGDEVQHRVVLTRPFLIQATPVTQAQFEAVMGCNPSHFKEAGPEAPVETVSWYEAVAFCNELSRQEGLEPAYVLHEVTGKPGEEGFAARVERPGLSSHGYRLPTEAEWEYACRAGTTTAIYGATLEDIAWFDGNSGPSTHPVGKKQPNAWGLYDMLGNVWEWCADLYRSYPNVHLADALGALPGSARVLRGGSWVSRARLCRAADRFWFQAGGRYPNVGLRLARSV